ncbi:MAG TPA: PrpR N-terminal domain-containing protein [Candidatus Scatomonas merdigallinarum]|nr:PrpR N-terminal domain-containing protein [Candidatus Scatomonas merdigallinarum]
MIRIIKTPEHVQGRTALMGYSNIVNCAKSICEVLEYDIDMFTISSEDEVERVLLEKQNNSVFCQSILDKSPCLIYATDKQNQLIYTNRKPEDRKLFEKSKLKLATPISNGGLTLTPPGYSTGIR